MTEEKIIKAIKLAEGFELNEKLSPPNSLVINYRNTSHVMKINEIKQWELYPYLLYKAIEGWNKTRTGRFIEIHAGSIKFKTEVFETDIIFYNDYEDNEYLTRQEQAIEKALEELL